MYDVAIIGCGVIGAAAAYALSRYDNKVVILEAENEGFQPNVITSDLSRPQPERAGKPGYQERLSLTDGLRLDVETERRRNLRPRGGNR